MINVLTDNRNRTAGEIRHLFLNTVAIWKLVVLVGCLNKRSPCFTKGKFKFK